MKRDLTIALIACVLIAAALATGVFLGWRMDVPPAEPLAPQIDTVYVWKRDTVRIMDTQPAGSVVVKLPVYNRDNILSKSDNILAGNDTNAAVDHFPDSTKLVSQPDSVDVKIPIERRTYEGENYRAVVQGFRPELVSIDVRQQVVTVTEYKRKWWSVTVGPQLGYGFTPAGWQPYAGVGISVGLSF